MAFECGVCTSVYNTGLRVPLLLECGHTFCQSCVQHNLGPQRCCPYCRHPIQKHVDDLPRNYALENAMEAANLPLVELMDRWGLANAERMMVKPDHMTLDSLMSRKGYTGEVWKGSLWGKPVAVKLLPLLDVDERQLECLRREVAVLLHTTGECKQVCIYKGFCVKNGSFAIIMKLYSYSLANRVSHAPGRRLPLPLALKYAIDIVKGLVELHRLGVIAADLKPDNVLIDEELGDAVIADFGISSVVTTTIGNSGVTGRGSGMRSSGAMRGTPNYMAPEQFAPGCGTTNKVDIWGFAATLLHMVTGSPPWQHDTLMQICTAVGVAKQAPPLPEGLPGPLQALMQTCFDADPARRPTAVYLLKALQAMGPVLQQHMLVGPVSSSTLDQQQQQQQQLAHPASKASGSAVDDKQAGLDQYLAQLGLSSRHSRLESVSSGGGALPSAPPLPRGSSSSGGGGRQPGAAVAADCLGRRSSSAGGASSRQKLPRVLWTEEEALREQQEAIQQRHQQQPRQQAANAALGQCLGAALQSGSSVMGQQQQQQQQKPHWAPHHVRSASEQVSGLSSRAYQQQQLQQQQMQPQDVVGGAHWPQQQQQQQQQAYHARSRSDVVHGWGASTAEPTAPGGFVGSRGAPGGADSGMLLPTHYEVASPLEGSTGKSPDPTSAAATPAGVPGLKEDPSAAAGVGQVKRQRQQWNLPTAAQQQPGGQAPQQVPACAAADDDAAAYGKLPLPRRLSNGVDAADCSSSASAAAAAAGGQDPMQQWHSQQQQALAVVDADPDTPMGHQRPWWETPFDVATVRSPSPAAAAAVGGQKVPLPAVNTDAAAAGVGAGAGAVPARQGPPPPLPLLVHAAHMDDVSAAPVPVGSAHAGGNGGSNSSASSNGSLSRAASCDTSFTGREGAGACASVCSRPGSARRPARTLSNLLLGRAGSRAALTCELPASDTASCSSAASGMVVAPAAAGGSGSGSSSSYPASLAKIRMAFGPASPERVPRGGAFGSNGNLAGSSGSILSAAACAAAAGGAAIGAGAAAAALCTGTSAAAAGAGAGVVALAGGAAAASLPVAAAAVGAVGSAGVVAAMASRFTKGSRGSKAKPAAPPSPRPGKSAPPSPASVATANSSSLPSSAEKPSRWRALFGSPSRRRPSPQDRGGPRRHCSVLDTAGMPAGGSNNGSAADFSAASCSSSPISYVRQPSPAPVLAAAAAEGAPAGLLGSPASVRPCSPTKQGGNLVIATGGHEASGELHKLPLTPQSAAAAAAAAEAARASGACSPLKAHARNLSLPSKLMLLGGSTDVSPAPSPNPVCSSGSSSPAHSQRQQQQQLEAAARSGSPSRLGSSSRHSSSGDGGGAAAPCTADTSTSSSSTTAPSSHSQLLAEALQLEVLARGLSQGGRHEEAEAALRNSLAMISKQLGPGHPNTVAATTRLALHLNRNAKHTEAERLLRQVLTHKQAMLGRKHPQVAAACINLAACLYSQGHYNAAARLYSTALEVRKASLGDIHADTAACLNNLALCYSRLCDWSQAEQMFREALSARVAALGQLHPDVAITAHQLGHCLGQLGQHSEALVYHKQGLWVRQQQERRGPQPQPQQQQPEAAAEGSSGAAEPRGSSSGGSGGNPGEDLVASHRCVALCLARLGCDSQAQEHLTHVLLVRTSQVDSLKPPPPPGAQGGSGGTLGGRTHSRVPSSRLDDVDWGVLADGDSRLSKDQADGLLALASAAEELARCLSRQGKHADAEEQYWKSLEARSQVLGSRHELVTATEEQLRNCLEQQC